MEVTFWPMATISHMAGVWTVVVVTFHRYMAVCLPHHVKKFANLSAARYQASASAPNDSSRLSHVVSSQNSITPTSPNLVSGKSA